MSGLLGALGGLGQGLSQAGQNMYGNALEEIRMRRLAELQIQSEQRAEERNIQAEGRQATREGEVYTRNLADQRSLLEEQREHDRAMIEGARGYESSEKRDFLKFQRDMDKGRYESIYGPDGSVIERDTHSGQTRPVLTAKGGSGKAGGTDKQKLHADLVNEWRKDTIKVLTEMDDNIDPLMLGDQIPTGEEKAAKVEALIEQVNATYRKAFRMHGLGFPGDELGVQGHNIIQDGGKTYAVVDGKVYELEPSDMAASEPARESAGRKVDRLKSDREKGEKKQQTESPGLLDRAGSAIRGALGVREGGLLEHPEDIKNIPETIRNAANLPEDGLLGALEQKAESSLTGEAAVQARRERREKQRTERETKAIPLPSEQAKTATAPSAEEWTRHVDAIHQMLVERGEQLNDAAKGEVIEQLNLLLTRAPDDAGRRRIQFYLDKLQGTP